MSMSALSFLFPSVMEARKQETEKGGKRGRKRVEGKRGEAGSVPGIW